MIQLAENIKSINQELEGGACKLVAVSKTKPIDILQEAYDLGVRDFGENKAQELAMKHEVLPKDIVWHMIGHLQTNKVKLIASFVHLIHAVDSFKLLKEINKRAKQHERTIDCLLQVHIAEEESKFGFSQKELYTFMQHPDLVALQHVRLKGLMGMATFTEDVEQVRKEFQGLKQLFDDVSKRFQLPNMDFTEVSMGMSGDYRIAIEEGSTMIRVGSLIFGARNYG